MFEELLDFDCVCGKHHSLVTRDFIIEDDALPRLPGLLKKLGISGGPLAVYDANTYAAANPKLSKYAPDLDTLILKGEEIHPDETQIDAVIDAIDGHSALLAVGSGVVNDVVRYAAFKKGLPFVSVPTAASVDGYTSSGAVVTINGAKKTIPTAAPIAVVCDLEIIASAPKRMAASGVGDMLSKYVSIADWRVGHLITGEYYCPKIAQLELDALDIICQNIDGIARGDTYGIGKLIEGLLISGLAIQLAQVTRPASSFEHHFSHYLEVVQEWPNVNYSALHGEKVGIATITAAGLYPKFARKLKAIFEDGAKNNFSSERVTDNYKSSPQHIIDALIAENTPTVSLDLDVEMLKENYPEVLKTAGQVPGADYMRGILKKVGGLKDYGDIGMTKAQFDRVFDICCYIRNRFTLLRVVKDYDLVQLDNTNQN